MSVGGTMKMSINGGSSHHHRMGCTRGRICSYPEPPVLVDGQCVSRRLMALYWQGCVESVFAGVVNRL
jgi:hypothetical protein